MTVMESSNQIPPVKEKTIKKQPIILAAIFFLLLVFNFYQSGFGQEILSYFKFSYQKANASKVFAENFDNGDMKLNETGKMSESASSDWWLNSGGYFYYRKGTGRTFQNLVRKSNKWHKKYNQNNPKDTDKGAHPQNIFRLVTRSKWENLTQQVYFNVKRNNLSKSKNRNESNGILLFNRYQDGDNLYYTGVRVDGRAVIKKKLDGKYYTLGLKRIIKGKYDRKNKPNLLPRHSWFGIKSEVITNSDDTVTINLYTDENRSGNWTLVLTAVDDNQSYGGAAITSEGYGGLRTDFMDVEFDEYKIEEVD